MAFLLFASIKTPSPVLLILIKWRPLRLHFLYTQPLQKSPWIPLPKMYPLLSVPNATALVQAIFLSHLGHQNGLFPGPQHPRWPSLNLFPINVARSNISNANLTCPSTVKISLCLPIVLNKALRLFMVWSLPRSRGHLTPFAPNNQQVCFSPWYCHALFPSACYPHCLHCLWAWPASLLHQKASLCRKP